MSPLREDIKSFAEGLLGSAASLAVARRRLRGRRLILSYHNIVARVAPGATGDASLHLPFDQFRQQLDAIAEVGFPVVGVDDPQRRGDSPPEIAISFDDAYAGALLLAVPELARRGLPATIFVAPGLLGSDATWWDRLALTSSGAVPPPVRDGALDDLAGDTTRVLDAAATRGWTMQPPRAEFRIASEQELSAAVATHPGLSFGAHSWSHANLARVNAPALQRELETPLTWLRERFPSRAIPWLAYPYGLESGDVRSAAAKAGYRGAFRVTGGWSAPGWDPLESTCRHASLSIL